MVDDLDVDQNSEPTEISLAPPPPSYEKSPAEIAQEVVAGHWGRGLIRKRRLIEAGYVPEQIDEEVRKIFNR